MVQGSAVLVQLRRILKNSPQMLTVHKVQFRILVEAVQERVFSISKVLLLSSIWVLELLIKFQLLYSILFLCNYRSCRDSTQYLCQTLYNFLQGYQRWVSLDRHSHFLKACVRTHVVKGINDFAGWFFISGQSYSYIYSSPVQIGFYYVSFPVVPTNSEFLVNVVVHLYRSWCALLLQSEWFDSPNQIQTVIVRGLIDFSATVN